MDVMWFKKRQKEVGVTAEDIAEEMGRSRSNVSHIYAGKQRMSLEWAKAFAKALKVPVDEVLKHAGAMEATEAQTLAPGFAESDAAPFVGAGNDAERNRKIAAITGGDRPGVDVWKVRSNAMQMAGYLPGDLILVDTHQSERCKAGDTVIAQIYNWQTGLAETILRRYEPPVLIGVGAHPEDTPVRVVDGSNVVIRGKVVASWRI